jgi:hypothetical protein
VEQCTLSRIRELRAAGYTTRQIADGLNRQGFTTRRGTAWRFQYVAEYTRSTIDQKREAVRQFEDFIQ